MPSSPPPLEWVRADLLDYRWARGGPEHRTGGIALIEAYNLVEKHLREGLGKPQLPNAYRTRWEAVSEMCDDIKARKGLVNPLIVFEVPDGRLLVTVGNQRLCALRVLGWRVAPVWKADRWEGSPSLMKQFYKEVPSRHF